MKCRNASRYKISCGTDSALQFLRKLQSHHILCIYLMAPLEEWFLSGLSLPEKGSAQRIGARTLSYHLLHMKNQFAVSWLFASNAGNTGPISSASQTIPDTPKPWTEVPMSAMLLDRKTSVPLWNKTIWLDSTGPSWLVHSHLDNRSICKLPEISSGLKKVTSEIHMTKRLTNLAKLRSQVFQEARFTNPLHTLQVRRKILSRLGQ